MSDLYSVFDTPQKAALKSRVQKLQIDKCKLVITRGNLKRKNNRLLKKKQNMKNIINVLKKKMFITDDLFKKLNLKAEVKDMYERIYHIKKSPFYRQKYSPALRKFAITLNFYSPSAYKYVRHAFNASLPHPRVLSKWYENITSEPGFTKQALDILKKKYSLSGKRLICTLVADEMAIRHQTIWNGKNTEGLVDYGVGFAKNNEIATQAYVFILVCMNENWKIPIGYFFVNGLPAETRANLISMCLRECYHVGVDIIAVTFDGCSSNINAANILGCELKDLSNLKTIFKHPECDKKVAIILDPCHMIKLVRNTFESKRLIFDNNNKEIRWQLLRNLNGFQINEGLHFANKIGNRHINFRNEIMKVKLATQLLSMSVANALKLCQDISISPLFTNTEATVDFIKMFNNLFDIFNSRAYNQFAFKRPICPENANSIMTYFEKAKEYISSLCIYNISRRIIQKRIIMKVNKKKLIECKAKTGFLGFLICIESLKHLYTTLVEKEQRLSYIATYRLSQDHIETFFGNIRKHGGHNNNPNVVQFKGIYKKLLNHLKLRASFTGNCIPLENFNILNCTSAVVNMNRTSGVYDKGSDTLSENVNIIESDAIVQDNVELFANILNNERLTDSVKQIVGYISGWVAQKLVKVIKCEFCLKLLYTDKQLWFHRLVTVKDMGGLCFSSKDLYEVCLKSEAMIKNYVKEKGLQFTGMYEIERLKTSILKCFLNSSIFHGLNDHSKEQPPTLNHRLQIIRAIIDKYIKVRLHHAHKHNPAIQTFSKRQQRNKLNLFEGK